MGDRVSVSKGWGLGRRGLGLGRRGGLSDIDLEEE